MKLTLTFTLCFAATSALAAPPVIGPQTDLSGVSQQITSAVAAATPSPCSAPLADTFTGTAGTATPCMARPDATRPTQVQPIRSTTDATGAFTISWPVAFSAAPTYVHAEILGGSAPYQCDISTVTATGATGKCYQLIATTLPGVVTSVLGLVVTPFTTAASMTVMVVGRL